MVFEKYSQYYDLLYRDKDYTAEVDYVESLLKKYSTRQVKTILDLGCGTGRHDILFAEKGYSVTGIDLSPDMIKIAQSKTIDPLSGNLRFQESDVRTYSEDNQYDAVISLFHVASYQTTNNDFEQYLKTAYTHLKPGGLFLFDFWYGPAVLTDMPQKKDKTIENEEMVIVRHTEPILCPNDNIVDVHFDIHIEDKKKSSTTTFKELHRMRYWFLPELKFLILKNNLTQLCQYKWATDVDMSFESWYGVIVVQK